MSQRRTGGTFVFVAAVTALLCASFLFAPLEASAQYFEDFEEYTAGDPVGGLGGWATWDEVTDPAIDAPVSSEQAFSGDNSLEILTTTDIVQPFDGAYDSGRWTVSAQVYVPSTASGAGYFILLNTYEVGPDKDWSTQVIFDTDLGEVRSIGGSSFAQTGTLDLTVDAWFEVQVRIDLDANQQEILIDGETLASGIWQLTGSGTIECIDLYGNSIDPSFYYDDIVIFADCNLNGIDDAVDIEDGLVSDCNDNGVPDECEVFEAERVTLADAESGDDFGTSIAMEGAVALVGTPFDGAAAISGGSATVYRYSGTGWGEPVNLEYDETAIADRVGSAVALDGDLAALGIARDDDAGSSSGSVVLFEYDSATDSWSQGPKLTADDAELGDEFGFALSLAEDVLIVGARGDDDVASVAGAVYVFRDDATGWSEEVKLTASDGVVSDQIGYSVAATPERFAAGAPFVDDAVDNVGAVYVFDYDESLDEWTETVKLMASDPAASANFGSALALGEDVLVVGAPADSEVAFGGGAVYVFRYDGTEWVEEAKLVSGSTAIEGFFGTSVALSGDRLVVGAPGEAAGAGAVYVYEYDGFDWGLVNLLPSPGGSADDAFGTAVALTPAFLVAGAPGETDVVDGGAVHFVLEADCDGNGVLDSCDIEDGALADANDNGVPDLCETGVVTTSGPAFIRGDANGNGSFSALLDSLFILEFAFASGDAPPCLDAADVDDNGIFSALLDSLYTLTFAFAAGPPPPTPGQAECGSDPTADTLDCAVSPPGC